MPHRLIFAETSRQCFLRVSMLYEEASCKVTIRVSVHVNFVTKKIHVSFQTNSHEKKNAILEVM
jgi:hypothetical protein